MGQDSKPLTEQEIKDMFTDIFQNAEITKEEVLRLFKIVSDRYL